MQQRGYDGEVRDIKKNTAHIMPSDSVFYVDDSGNKYWIYLVIVVGVVVSLMNAHYKWIILWEADGKKSVN